jgi:predicted MFS family arabinose efflux permease
MASEVTDSPQPRWLPRIFAATLFFVGSDLYLVSPLLLAIHDTFRTPLGQTGLLVTTFAVGYIVASPVAGWLTDHFGRRPVYFSGLAFFIVTEWASAAAPSFAWLLVARALTGAAAGAVTPIAYTLTADYLPAGHRVQAMAVLSMGFSLATVLGVPLGLAIEHITSWRGTLAVLGVAMFAAALLNAAALHRLPPVTEQVAAASHPRRTFSTKGWLSPAIPTLFASFATFSAVGLLYTYLPAMLTRHGLSNLLLLPILSGYGLMNVLGNFLAGRLGTRWGSETVVRRAQLIEMASIALLIGASLVAPLMVIVLTASTFFAAQAYVPNLKSLAARVTPTVRGESLAWNNAAMYAGLMTGSLAGSLVYQPSTYWRLGILALIVLAASHLIVRGSLIPVTDRRRGNPP